MRALGLLAVAAVVAGLTGCVPATGTGGAPAAGAPSASGPAVMGDAQMLELNDHPERFKGQTLTAPLTVWMSPTGNKKLKESAGQEYKFYKIVWGKGRLELTVTLPEDPAALPNAAGGDQVLVTFVCQEGKTDAGNRALKVERPR